MLATLASEQVIGGTVGNNEVHHKRVVCRVIAHRVMARIEKGIQVVLTVVRSVVVDNGVAHAKKADSADFPSA